MLYSVILTTYKEPGTIGEAISAVIRAMRKVKQHGELIIVAGDDETFHKAEESIKEDTKERILLLHDDAKGKPAALNLAVSQSRGEILFFTDGDMTVDADSLEKMLPHFEEKKVGGVSGHPISVDDRNNRFGYYGHLFCEAAHQKRLRSGFTPMSGYLYAIRKRDGLFPLPEQIRAEDAYISAKVGSTSKIEYEPEAYARVRFPKNQKDWITQKLRSVGGNVQLHSVKARENGAKGETRSILQDLRMLSFPITYARNIKEMWWSKLLYPLRLYLWIRIYIQHLTNSYSKGAWKRIESTK